MINRLFRFTSLVLFVLFLSACGSGGGGSSAAPSDTSTTVATSLTSPRLLVVADTELGTIQIAWVAIEGVAGEDVTYRIYVTEEDPAGDVTAYSPVKTVINGSEAVIDGLTSGLTYFITITAQSGDSLTSGETVVHTTTETATVLADQQVLVVDEQVTATPASRTDEQTFVYSGAGQAVVPQTGNFLIGEDDDGQSYFRAVTDVTQQADEVTVTTEPAVMEDLVDSFALNVSQELIETGEVEDGTTTARSVTTTGTSPHYKTSGGMVDVSQQDFVPYTKVNSAVQSRMLTSSVTTNESTNTSRAVATRQNVTIRGASHLLAKIGATTSETYEVILSNEIDGYVGNVEIIGCTDLQGDAVSVTEKNWFSLVEQNGDWQLLAKPEAMPTEENWSQAYRLILRASAATSSGVGVNDDSVYYVDLAVDIDVAEDDFGYKVEVGEQFDFDVLLKYEPTLTTNIEFSHGRLKTGVINAHVDLSMVAAANYAIQGLYQKSVDTTLFKRTFLSVYAAGPVPVYQRTVLTVRAEASVNASGEITAAAVARANVPIDFGLTYDPDKGEFVKNASMDVYPSITFDVEGQAGASAELRLIPEIQVSFYEVATGQLSVQPYINASVEAEMMAHLDFLDLSNESVAQYQLTQLNSNLGFDIFAGLSLDLFVAEVDIYPYQGIYNWNKLLFSQPQLGLTHQIDGDASGKIITLNGFVIEQGENNPLDPASVEFLVIPRDGIALETVGSDTDVAFERQFHLTDAQIAANPEYTIYFSGYGGLGALTRRYVVHTINFAADEDNDGLPDAWELQHSVSDPDADRDNDALTNLQEYNAGTHPKRWDSDGDCLPDGWEVANSLNPLSATLGNDSVGDPDGDGLLNIEEYLAKKINFWDTNIVYKHHPELQFSIVTFSSTVRGLCTNSTGDTIHAPDETIVSSDPQKRDTDGDTLSDLWEAENGLLFIAAGGAIDPNNRDGDLDGDGLTNIAEYGAGSQANSSDTDADGMDDLWEVTYDIGVNTYNPDSDFDHDGKTNITEYNENTNPTVMNLDFRYELVEGIPVFNWDAIPNVIGYKLYRYPDLFAAADDDDMITLTATTYTDNSAPTGVELQYGLRAVYSRYDVEEEISAGFLSFTLNAQATWYADFDDDGFGNAAESQLASEQPVGYVADNTDCDDTDADINPDAVEIAGDGIDQNCDGVDVAVATTPLNDTGIVTFGDGSSNSLISEPSDHPGQDASFGRDAAAQAGTLTKVGGGNAGFDYTKIASTGFSLADQDVDYATTAWAAVQDNHTGLMWEVKSDDGTLRDSDWRYSWYNSTGINDGGSAGTANGGSCFDSDNCDTEKYVAAVNNVGLAGYHDWRLPTREELRSIVDYGTTNPAIDSSYFPNSNSSYFWSASPYAANTDDAWLVNFNYGSDHAYNKSYYNYVRLVRGGQ